jgi:hypothetical protein
VRRDRKPAEVSGDLFSPEHPVHPDFAHNYRTVFFVAKEPLEPKTTYEVTFTATIDGAPVRHVWTFRTASR